MYTLTDSALDCCTSAQEFFNYATEIGNSIKETLEALAVASTVIAMREHNELSLSATIDCITWL